jgi:hypothetical protein
MSLEGKDKFASIHATEGVWKEQTDVQLRFFLLSAPDK